MPILHVAPSRPLPADAHSTTADHSLVVTPAPPQFLIVLVVVARPGLVGRSYGGGRRGRTTVVPSSEPRCVSAPLTAAAEKTTVVKCVVLIHPRTMFQNKANERRGSSKCSGCAINRIDRPHVSLERSDLLSLCGGPIQHSHTLLADTKLQHCYMRVLTTAVLTVVYFEAVCICYE